MDTDADLKAMLKDFSSTVTIGGAAYDGILNPEEHTIGEGVERIPVLLMRRADIDAAAVAIGTDVVVDGTTYQTREIRRLDDGRLGLLILAV